MTDFKDSQGRIWTIKLTLGAAMRVRDRLGIDVLNPVKLATDGDEPMLTRLAYDMLLVGQIVATLLEEQAKERGIDPVVLMDDFDGETCAAAHNAFLEEYERFFMGQKNERAISIVRLMRKVAEEALKAEETSGETSYDSQDEPVSTITQTSPTTN